MADERFAVDPVTGLRFRWDERTGDWIPFADADNALDATLINAGAQLTKYGRGLSSMLGIGDRDELTELQREADADLEGLRAYRPVASGVGQALPGLATLPVGSTAALAGRLGLGQSLALSGSLGLAEGALDLDVNRANQQMRMLEGIGYGLAGEGAGRLAGRVLNGIRGLGSQLPVSDAAQWLDSRGMKSLVSERLPRDGTPWEVAQRIEQGSQASLFPPSVFGDVLDERQLLQNRATGRAIGLTRDADVLTPDVLAEADDLLTQRYQALHRQTFDQGRPRIFSIDDQTQLLLDRNRGQVKELQALGEFRGLDDGKLAGPELIIARRALAQDAADAAARGRGELADRINAGIENIDRIFENAIDDPNILAEYKRTRELYNNFRILTGPGNVVDDLGNVSSKKLRNRLAQGTGYGKRFKLDSDAGLEPETAELFNVTRNLSRSELQPFRTSMTPQQQALGQAAEAAGDIVGGTPAGITRGALHLGTPLLYNMLERQGLASDVIGGLLQPSAPFLGRVGGELGGDVFPQLLGQE